MPNCVGDIKKTSAALVSFATIPWRKQSDFCLHYHYFHQHNFYLHFNTCASSWGLVRVGV